jgi:hypothetical protein
MSSERSASEPGLSCPEAQRDLKFAAKDNFDVAGFVTGAGSPDWKETHFAAYMG